MEYFEVFKEAKKNHREVLFASDIYNKFKKEIDRAASSLGYEERYKRSYFPKKDHELS